MEKSVSELESYLAGSLLINPLLIAVIQDLTGNFGCRLNDEMPEVALQLIHRGLVLKPGSFASLLDNRLSFVDRLL